MTEAQIDYAKSVQFTTYYRSSAFILDTRNSYVIAWARLIRKCGVKFKW